MININQTSENSKIYIQRNITNDEPVINNYVTEDELQEQLKNINIPYLVVDHIRFENGDWGYGIVSGDYNGVLQAIKENKPQIIYIPYENSGTYLLPHSFQYNSIQDGIYVSTNVHNAVDMNFHYYVYLIKENSVEQTVRETRYVQEKLVSGENIKTINGNDILGSGDIVIESGNGNIVELTQSEYDNITPEENTLYVISDAPAIEIPNASIPYLIVSNTAILGGNFNDVYNAIENGNPYILYINVFDGSGGNKFSPAEEVFTKNGMIECSYSFTYFSSYGNNINVKYRVVNIYPDRVSVYSNSETTVPKTFKTINNQSIIGSGNITIEAGGTEILYLWKLNGTTTYGADHNANVRNTLLSLSSSEEYPIIVVKDYNNDTICNNVYANASTDYVEIQCCNSRIGGTPNDLTDERYELLPNGMFRYVKNDVVATQNYVDEQIGNINIESGGNIVELTQSEYNSITPEPDTLYLISDSDINTSLKTINGESIIGEGDINIDVDLTGYATTAYVDEQIGDINSVLENIIG